jgi:hypothetical protein
MDIKKTMKTVKELDAELELLKSDIEKTARCARSTLKQKKSDLLISISSATIRERRQAERRARNRSECNTTKRQLRLAKKYDIEWV